MKIKHQDGSEQEITIEQFGQMVNGDKVECLQITEISDSEKAELKEKYPENYIDPDEFQELSRSLLAEAMNRRD